MTRHLPLLFLWTMASVGFASGDVVFPKDVQRFIDKREGCDHFRGEVGENNDKQRQREIQANIKKLCTGTDRQLNTLLKKYQGKPEIIERLNEFEKDIEAQ
ncbi:hypothetical protein ACUHMQ_16510 [Chitinimonas sp. PSY-7]|uniref:hypothetical protein n=1 Tax=Chitinimonas sp. PSY-7 TaxID=3459088 RepID=UPI00403FD996